jgi:signal transduction histidine kinase
VAVNTVTTWPLGVERRHAGVPVAVAATALAAYVLCVVVAALEPRSGVSASDDIWFAGWLVCALAGAVLARASRGRRYGWFLLGIGVGAEVSGILGLVLRLSASSSWPAPVVVTLSLVKSLVEIPPQTLLMTLGLLIFPSGRLWSTGAVWRWTSRAAIGSTTALMVIALLSPGALDDTRLSNPLGVNALRPLVGPLELASFVVLAGCLAVGVSALVGRWRRGDVIDRRAVAVVICAASWVLVIVLVGIVLTVLHRSTPALLGACLVAATVAALPVAALTTTVRRTMFDVELALNRNLTYLALTLIVIGAYALTVTLLGRLFEHRSEFGVSLVVTGLIAVLFGPLKLWVQQGVEYVLLGRRAMPYRALATLGRRLDASLSPTAALDAAVRTVAETFRLPYAVLTIEVDGEPVAVASHGEPTALRYDYPLLSRGEQRGSLQLAPRTTFEKLTPSDERLLADFIAQILGAVEAVHLTEQLRRSRTSVVLANEDERRRIRRELHDGIGPVLASTALAVQRVERQLDSSDPRRALLAQTRADVQHAVDDIRRVVHGLRPAALDELGLAAALAQRAHALTDRVDFRVSTSEGLDKLPAAVEVVAYRVTTEAMTNVVRHAGAMSCSVEVLVEDDELVLRIRDDGTGTDLSAPAGVGLSSMRERVAELGGRFLVESTSIGTEVQAWLPLS